MAKQNHIRKETSADRLVYFAAERTLLTWVRVGLGLMALGFVVDRFALFLRFTKPAVPGAWSGSPFSSWAGIALVIVGIIANITAAVRYLRFEIAYHRKRNTSPGHGLSLGIFLTVIVSLLGIIIVLILFGTMA